MPTNKKLKNLLHTSEADCLTATFHILLPVLAGRRFMLQHMKTWSLRWLGMLSCTRRLRTALWAMWQRILLARPVKYVFTFWKPQWKDQKHSAKYVIFRPIGINLSVISGHCIFLNVTPLSDSTKTQRSSIKIQKYPENRSSTSRLPRELKFGMQAYIKPTIKNCETHYRGEGLQFSYKYRTCF